MSKRLPRLPVVEDRTGNSRSTIYEMVRDGKFPRSVKIGARSVGWIESEIDEWIETREPA